MATDYTPRERFWLWALAAAGFLGVNAAFAYGLFFDPGALRGAMTNPVSLAFVVEAFLLVAALAYLLPKWGVCRVSRGLFVALALVGSLAFALPVALLRRSDPA